jgi:hypothetical protein
LVDAAHVVFGVAVVTLNLMAGGWGAVAWWRRNPSVVFWYLLRAAQVSIVVQVGLGLALLAAGQQTPDGLHLLYGILPLGVTLVSEAMRVGAAQQELAGVADVDELDHREQVLIARRVVRREMGIMAVGALVNVTLALRAAAGGGLFG